MAEVFQSVVELIKIMFIGSVVVVTVRLLLRNGR